MQDSDSHSSPSCETDSATDWDSLGSDVTELILSHLPISSIIRASSVSRFWNAVIHSHSFRTRVSDSKTLPWLFFCGSSYNNLVVFALDPESPEWIKLPHTFFHHAKGILPTAPSVFFFPGKSCSKSVHHAPVKFPIYDPQIGLYNDLDCTKLEGCLDMEIYNPCHDFSELSPSLPDIFMHGNSPQLLCSSLFQEKLYVFGIHSSFISSLDLKKRSWSNVRTLRPPGMLYAYLISCHGRLVLAGVCSVDDELEFNLWEINERTLEFREIGIMPEELHSHFFGGEEDWKFGSLKCVGSGNLVYVFSKERSRNYPVCVCEIGSSGDCSWRSVPNLPANGSEFDRIIGFCSSVTLQDIFGNAG